ncbi:hypothetical protein HYH03_014365 [Edaphochlamys debaryana]|uniref:Uncharacterized protein n=1 Tax=Edaphochlamys debaryana TaxID=47281 RepID=A0A835XMV6_9CHLO|nr:hypothetical protein HYH03_014365 [Edaphochlamys debaryana]|eukprot:KAG2486993.1 hypothetical protein HYH03_014365 [Edaphochlamys debaryana]
MSPRVSNHPSVAALYQYAQEVRTPASCRSRPATSETPTACADMVKALEGAVEGAEAEVTSEELAGSFGQWLTSMGMDASLLPEVALSKMRSLWEKAKEAIQLQALVEQLKESELQLAQQDAEDSARHVGLLLAENEDLQSAKARLQEQLMAAEERLVQLALAPTHTVLPPSPLILSEGDAAEPAFGAEASSSGTWPHHGVESFRAMASPVGFHAYSPAFGERHGDNDGAQGPISAPWADAVPSPQPQQWPEAEAFPASHALSPLQESTMQTTILSVSVGSALGGQRVSGPGSPSSSTASFAGRPAAAASATPGLSVISRSPEAMPFSAWAAGMDVLPTPPPQPFGASPSSASVGLSPMDVDDYAAASPIGELRSFGAGFGQASSPQMFGAGFGQASSTQVSGAAASHASSSPPSFGGFHASPGAVSGPGASPQPSAGLSVTSQWPQPVAFASWAAEQGEAPHDEALSAAMAASPGVMMSPPGLSPQASAGLSMVSQLPQPVAFSAWAMQPSPEPEPLSPSNSLLASPAPPPSASRQDLAASPDAAVVASAWDLSAASTPAGPFVNAASPSLPSEGVQSPALLSNPLFDFEGCSPAPSCGPTPLPQRVGSPVQATSPEPAYNMPSLPPTPVAEGGAEPSNPFAAAADADDSSMHVIDLGDRSSAFGDSVPALDNGSLPPFGDHDEGAWARQSANDLFGAMASPAGSYGAASPGPFGDMPTPVASRLSPPGWSGVEQAADEGIASRASSPHVHSLGSLPEMPAEEEAATAASPAGSCAAAPAPLGGSDLEAEAAVDAASSCKGSYPVQAEAAEPGLEQVPAALTAAEPFVPSSANASSAQSLPAESISFSGMGFNLRTAEEVEAGSTAESSDSRAGSPAASGGSARAEEPLAAELQSSVTSAAPQEEPPQEGAPSPGSPVQLEAHPSLPLPLSPLGAASIGTPSPVHGSGSERGRNQEVSFPALLASAPSLDPASASSSAAKAGALPGSAAAGLRGGSYPNTPYAAWPASPTSTIYATPLEAFATPTSLASFCSVARLTALRMYSALAPASGGIGMEGAAGESGPSPITFTLMVPPGGAATPGLAMGVPFGGFGANAGPAVEEGTPSPVLPGPANSAAAPGAYFGSPLPLMALTPVQLRALDNLADRFRESLSPPEAAALAPPVDAAAELATDARAEASTTTAAQQPRPAQSPAASARAPAGFAFAQLLAQLQSPLPAHHHRRSAAAAGAAGRAGPGVSRLAAASSAAAAMRPIGEALAAEAQAAARAPEQREAQAEAAAQAEAQEEAAVSEPAGAAPACAAAEADVGFGKLLAFLHAAGRPPAAAAAAAATNPAPHATNEAAATGADATEPAAPAESATATASEAAPTAADTAVAAAAAFSFAQLLAHLRSPLPQAGGARAQAARSSHGLHHPSPTAPQLVLAMPPSMDSPITAPNAGGPSDSPANSEAASFGFSTAAKQMSLRVTPSSTPGGQLRPVSFVHWAHDVPPAFRLESDARGGRAPPTTGSFSFGFGALGGGAAAGEDVTPAAHRYRSREEHAEASFGAPGLLQLGTSARPPGSVDELGQAPTVQHSPTITFALGTMPAAGSSPAFSFGGGAQRGGAFASPAFSFGAAGPAEAGTPVFGFSGPAGAVDAAGSPMFSFGLNPSGLTLAAVMAASPVFNLGQGHGQASPLSPAFSFGIGPAASAATAAFAASPVFGFVAPGPSSASPSSPAITFGAHLDAAAAAASGAALGSPAFGFAGSSPAFSFGHQLVTVPSAAATPAPVLARCSRPAALDGQDPSPRADAAGPGTSAMSPAPSLGMWAFMPQPAAGQGAASPSEMSFAFGPGRGDCAMGTPVWRQANGDGAAPDAAGAGAWEHSGGFSPTLFGMAVAGSPGDTPGVTGPLRQGTPPRAGASPAVVLAAPVPAPAVAAAAAHAAAQANFWGALLGALASPMPMRPRRHAHEDVQLGHLVQPSLAPQEQHEPPPASPAAADSPSLDTLAASTGVAESPGITQAGSATVDAAAEAASAATTFSFASAAAASAGASGALVVASPPGPPAMAEQDALPPPPAYEELPDLIARGLCLSASASLAVAASKLAQGAASNVSGAPSLTASAAAVHSAAPTCSSVGENGTPLAERLDPTGALLAAAAAIAAARASAGDDGAATPAGDRLFTPTRRRLPASASSCSGDADGAAAAGDGFFAAPASAEPLVLQSVSGSCSSGNDRGQAVYATQTAEPTPSRLNRTAASGIAGALSGLGAVSSVHDSPVHSFHASSVGSASAAAAHSPRATAHLPRASGEGADDTPPAEFKTPVSRRRTVSPRTSPDGDAGVAAAGSGSPQLHPVVVLRSPAPPSRTSSASPREGSAAAGQPLAAAADADAIEGAAEQALVMAEMGDVRESIKGFVSSASSTPQPALASAARSAAAANGDPAQRLDASVGSTGSISLGLGGGGACFSADAVQRLLNFAAEAAGDEEQSAAAASPADEQGQPQRAPPAAAPTGAPATSPALTKGTSLYDGLVPSPSPNGLLGVTPTFSYLRSGSAPATPLTAELASTCKSLAATLAAPGSASRAPPSAAAGAGGSSHLFWAPSASGPSAGPSGGRVTLETVNRRISANADLLLDFQGSPGRPLPGSVTGTILAAPRNSNSGSAPGLPIVSPARKAWSPGAHHHHHHPPHHRLQHGQQQQDPAAGHSTLTLTCTAPAAKPSGPAPTAAEKPAAAAQAAGMQAALAQRAPLARTQPGAIPASASGAAFAAGVSSAVATTAAAAVLHSAGTLPPAAHLPLSHRLGLWQVPGAPYGAAWGVPCPWPPGVQPPAGAAPVSAAAAAVVLPQAQPAAPARTAQPVGVAATPLPSAAVKPTLTSRDVQTTPGLELLATAKPADEDSPPQQPQPAAAKPAFRSRIPVPGAAPGPVPAAVPAARAPAPAPLPEPPRAAASADSDDEGSSLTTPGERVVRRRRLLTSAAAAGGPKRVPVPQRPPARAAAAPAGPGVAVGEDEVRRRAQVLGMRISPYLRPKKK